MENLVANVIISTVLYILFRIIEMKVLKKEMNDFIIPMNNPNNSDASKD